MPGEVVFRYTVTDAKQMTLTDNHEFPGESWRPAGNDPVFKAVGPR
jgi:hypothetical protein